MKRFLKYYLLFFIVYLSVSLISFEGVVISALAFITTKCLFIDIED